MNSKDGYFFPVGDQHGQAATEFIVAAVFVLVPLFIIIPLLGKYIDIKHACIQQARYEAWEYAAWFGPQERIIGEFISESPKAPYAERKKADDVRTEGIRYFFSNPWSEDGTLNPLWVDHTGKTLFVSPERHGPSSLDSKANPENNTPDGAGGWISKIIGFASDVISKIEQFLKSFNIPVHFGFDALDTAGYFVSNVAVNVRSIENILPERTSLGPLKPHQEDPLKNLQFTSQSAVLTNGWNSRSSKVAIAESKGLVFTSLLSPVTDLVNTVLSKIQSFFDLLKKMPILKIDVDVPSLPSMGYIKEDLVPLTYLEEIDADGKSKELYELKEEHGLYYFKAK